MNKSFSKTEFNHLSHLNFHHLYYFWQVAKTGNLSRAAQELSVSQSALSTQIRQLEDKLGQALFDRIGKRLKLTDTGHLVLGYADGIFNLSSELLGRLSGRKEGAIHLRIGSVSTLSRNYQENWLRPLLSDPSILLSLESGLLPGLVDRLLHHQLDVVLANEPVSASLEYPVHCRLIASQPMLIVGTPQKWDPKKFTLPADIQGAEMALPGPRHAARAQFDAMCASAGVAPVIRAEVDDMAMLRLIARGSSWLTLLPEVVVQDELKAGHLTAVCHIKNIQEHFYAITTQYRYRPPVLDLLMGMPGSQPSIASD